MSMLAVYLFYWLYPCCNSGTLSLWDSVPTPSDPVPKRENLFLFLSLCVWHFCLIYFCIFIICNYFISIYIILPYCYYFKVCTKCICNLALRNSFVVELSMVWLLLIQTRTKALSDQMSFRSISKCWYFTLLQMYCLLFWFWCDTYSALVSNANPQWGNPSQKTYPTIPWGCRFSTRRCTLHHLSHGYLYIYLPPIFWCLLSFVLMFLSLRLTVFVCSLWPKTHDHRSASTEGSAHMLLSEREKLTHCVYVHFCNM